MLFGCLGVAAITKNTWKRAANSPDRGRSGRSVVTREDHRSWALLFCCEIPPRPDGDFGNQRLASLWNEGVPDVRTGIARRLLRAVADISGRHVPSPKAWAIRHHRTRRSSDGRSVCRHQLLLSTHRNIPQQRRSRLPMRIPPSHARRIGSCSSGDAVIWLRPATRSLPGAKVFRRPRYIGGRCPRAHPQALTWQCPESRLARLGVRECLPGGSAAQCAGAVCDSEWRGVCCGQQRLRLHALPRYGGGQSVVSMRQRSEPARERHRLLTDRLFYH